MKTIQLEKTTIDIQLASPDGKEKLIIQFDSSDDNIKHLYKEFESLEKTKRKNAPKDVLEGLEFGKNELQKAIDLFFGEGTFEKVYAFLPSVRKIDKFFVQVVAAIAEELEMDDFKNFEEKYLS